jgi:putative nucleotidyltransferase with HDIG domain
MSIDGNLIRHVTESVYQYVCRISRIPRLLFVRSLQQMLVIPDSVMMHDRVDMARLRVLLALYDGDTYKHALRMASLARDVARYMRCSDDDVHRAYLAALLHDIGKSGIPRTIVQKHGTLSDEEWDIMRQHPQIGQDILYREGGIFAELAPLVVAHHERWDGLGYPRGLQREEVPMIARILAVVDTYDAMTSTRSYRGGLSGDEVEAELYRCAGNQLDGRIVTAFLSMRAEQKSSPAVSTLPALSSPSLRTRTSPL